MKRAVLSAVMTGAVLVGSAGIVLAQGTGEATYKANCQICHGETGAADTQMGQALKAKSFSDPEIAKMSDAQLLDVIKNGKTPMPPFKDKLSDDDIKAVISYLHVLQKKAGTSGQSTDGAGK